MSLILDGTNGETFPSWTTSGRPASPAVGQMGYNTTTGNFDAYTASGWTSIATSNGGTITGNLTFGTSNAGIVFNNSSATVNSTLNDYETGSWTPLIGGNSQGGSGGSGNVYSTQVGSYTKVGNLVIADCSVQLSTLGTNTGVVIWVLGWPFIAANNNVSPYCTVNWSNLGSSYVNIQGYFNYNQGYLHLVGSTSASASTGGFVAPTQLTSTSGFNVTMVYKANF